MAYDKREGAFSYRIEGERAVITGYDGKENEVEIPNFIEDKPVCKIGKKAFLSCKSLLKAVLPETMESMEEWAFAYCSNLKEVVLPPKRIAFGKGVFFSCEHLQKIDTLSKEDKKAVPDREAEETSVLLGAVPVLLDAEYLLTPWEVMEPHWVEKWDARMLSILRADDGEGYSKVVLCGEEDLSASFEEFVEKKRQVKANLAFIRLKHSYLLEEKVKEELLSYVRSHTKGCESEAAWELVKQHGDEKMYFEMFAECGCLSEENFDAILEDLGQHHAEMKAFFIRYKEKNRKAQDFFDTLSLDF